MECKKINGQDQRFSKTFEKEVEYECMLSARMKVNRRIGKRYKMINFEKTFKNNEKWKVIIVEKKIKESVIKIIRKNDRVIIMNVLLEDKI